MAGIAASALGQNVIVVMNDGTSHKFNADYIKEIRFAEDQEENSILFTDIYLNNYGGGNFNMRLTDASGENSADLDMWCPYESTSLPVGVYEVNESGAVFTVDPSWSSLIIGGEAAELASGSVTVSLEGKTYTVTVDVQSTDGKSLNGVYSGTPSAFTPWLDLAMEKSWYVENEQAPGDFYVKFDGNGGNWDMAVLFTADTADTYLPEGTFTYSETRAPFTFGPASYLDMYRPYSTNRFLPGSEITVKKDGDNYVITMNMNLADGRTADITYNGQISGTPTFSQPETETIVFDSMSYGYYGSGNFCPIFFYEDIALQFDMYGPDSAYLLPGTYTVGATEGNYIDTSDWSSYSVGDQITLLSSGTVTISDNDGVYTFDIDIVLANGMPVKAWYEGKIGGVFSSVVFVDADYAAYNDNPRPAGEFYVKFNAMNPYAETAFDIFGDTEASTLPAGKYVYSTENTPGTFGQKSYVEFFGPYSNNRMKEGSEINVAVEGNVYTVEMTLLFEDGRTTYLKYNGEIEGAPVFE